MIIDVSNNAAPLLNSHPQIEMIIDILSRKENYHVQILGMVSKKLQIALLKTIAAILQERATPKTLQHFAFVYSDVYFNPEKKTLLATSTQPTAEMLQNEKLRIIFFSSELSSFEKIKLSEFTDKQLLSVLKAEKNQLEEFHQVTIPEEICNAALSFAKHYLSSHAPFDKAVELLDSAAAAVEQNVTTDILLQKISHWTQIPVTHLLNNHFQARKLSENLHKQLYGQDIAINILAGVLQQAYLKLQEKNSPFCQFLFIGPNETGKSFTATLLAEHLFGQRQALLRVYNDETYQSLSEIKIFSANKLINLLDAFKQTPYAIVLIENVESAKNLLRLLEPIFLNGLIYEKEQLYDFRQAIFLLTTTVASDRLSSINEIQPALLDINKNLDLMQLVLNENDMTHNPRPNSFSLEDFITDINPILQEYFSNQVLSQINIIPFLPLDYSALEKIIRMRIKTLAKRLELNLGIELVHAPEVIKFLAHEAFWRKSQIHSLDKLLEHYLYSPVANEILQMTDDKTNSKRMLLKLNEEGHMLRCEFVSGSLYHL